jgi:WD40 repeat protein
MHGRPVTAAIDEAPDVFLSYSRRDQPIVLRIASALEEAGWRVWVDTEDIPAAAEWSEELAEGIRGTHTFVFVISPDSVSSTYCLRELGQAVELGKRLVPVIVRDTPEVPTELSKRQYLSLRSDDDFDAAVELLTAALGTDLEWVRGHRHWLMAALRWEASGGDRSLLLRGRDLKAAEAWLARQAERTEPRPTRLQTEFLIASRSWETRRLEVIVVAVAVALAVAVLLGVLALVQRNAARRAAAIARSRELAIAADTQLPLDPQRSLLLAIEGVKARPTAEASNALRQAVFANRLRVEIPTHGRTVSSLVSDVAFSPDGKTIAGALGDGTVRLADLASGSRPHGVTLPVPTLSAADPCTFFARSQGRTRIAFSSDGRFVAAVGDRGWIEVWRWPRPHKPVTSPFCLGPTQPSSGVVAAALGGGGSGAVAVTFGANDSVDVVEEDGLGISWRWASGAPPALVRLGRGPVSAAAFSAEGRTVAVVNGSHIRVWSSGRVSVEPLPSHGAYAIAVSDDGSRLAAALGRAITVWRPGAVERLNTHDVIRSLAMSRDGRFVAIGDQAGGVRIWRVEGGGPPLALAGSNGPVTAVAFSSDGADVLSGGDDGVLRVWDWEPARALSPVGPAAGAAPTSLTRDGRPIALDPRVRARAWITIARRSRSLDEVTDPSSLSFSRVGHRAAAPDGKSGFRVWDLSSSSKPRTIAAGVRVNAVAVSPDGRWLASAESNRYRLLRWRGSSSLVLARARVLGGQFLEFTAPAFSPDGRRVAGAAYNGKVSTIGVWELSGADAALDAVHSSQFSASGYTSTLAFSPDGTRVLAAMSDGTVHVWDLDRGSSIVLRGHHGNVADAAFSPDGEEVVSGGSADGSVRVWELDEGGKSVEIPGRTGTISGVAFTSGGRTIEAAGTTGVRAWTCDFCGPIGDVLAHAERMTVRSLTVDENALYLHER